MHHYTRGGSLAGACNTEGKVSSMMTSHAETIHQLLLQRPGLKVQQIAAELGLERAYVAATLHGLKEVVQDNSYRWWPKSANTPPSTEASKTPLARLCRYYLECLTRESGSGISLNAASGDSEFVTLGGLPFLPLDLTSAIQKAVRRMIRKVRQERGQLSLYIGYGVRVRLLQNGREEERRIEPILLYPIEDTENEPAELLHPATGIPLFNLEVLKSTLSVDSGNVMDEAVHLSDELGLANSEEDLPNWDEIVLRLSRCRPEWDWREPLNPYELSQVPTFDELEPGIYNRAILFAAPRSPFTYGLETELRKMEQLDEAKISETALGRWLQNEPEQSAPAEDQPILELLPLNSEQRQAVVQGLSAPLTVVTGPPGTGKSQVVVALLANMAYQGRSVLFASKNNHAVDVVEERANELGTHPLLLRLGKEEHHARLAEQISIGLSESVKPADVAGYAWHLRLHEEVRQRCSGVYRQIASVVNLRNEVDELERAAEPAREMLGPERFRAFRSTDANAIRTRVRAFETALRAAQSGSQAPLTKVFQQPRLSRQLHDAAARLRNDAVLLDITLPEQEDDIQRWESCLALFQERVEMASAAQVYWRALERLEQARPLEKLAQELTRIAEDSARSSLELWRRWVSLWPGRWNPKQRHILSEYVSLLQMIASGDRSDEGSGRKVFRHYYKVFSEVTKILPCWAVTSLSARGRLPFETALFDLVIIDEASQCDIASALPLLMRARRAVIIGDPLQLKHVSVIGPQQDRMILASHGLEEGRAAWAYSVNSLFDLARSLCRHEDIVNLRDHHRSHRDIITFSNRHYYRGGLRVATDHEALKRPNRTGPAVRWVDVRGKVVRPPRGGALNAAETDAVVAEIKRLVIDQGYQGSIGVVTPFRAQANRIRTVVHQESDLATRLAALEFIVDTVHGFQGDERDVIIFSPVVSAGIGESTLRFLKNHGNLFNVAITRARSELIVIGDHKAALGSSVSYLASFAEYAEGLQARESVPTPLISPGAKYPSVPHPEFVSEWERTFYKALYEAGLRPIPQYDEPPYTLDFALFDGERKLNIEVDGENYHRNWDGELCRRDQIRSRRLSDLGWDVMRLWVYEVRDQLDNCVARVRQWLEVRPPEDPLVR